MNKLITCLAALLLIKGAAAQNARVHIVVANTTVNSYAYDNYGNTLHSESVEGIYKVDPVTQNRTTDISFKLDQLKRIRFSVESGDKKTKSFDYDFFISPGDDITFNADFKKPKNGIIVTGKGSNNNQPELMAIRDLDVQQFYGDTLPRRVMAAINHVRAGNDKVVNEYITRYKPTAAFTRMLRYNAAYYPVAEYYNFKENNKYGKTRNAYKRNIAAWNGLMDSLFAVTKPIVVAETAKSKAAAKAKKDAGKVNVLPAKSISVLNNGDAMDSQQYLTFLSSFLMREKERLWNEATEKPVPFFKKWYNADSETGNRLMMEDPENLFQEKIINASFDGKTADYLYGVLVNDAIEESNPQNLVVIFDRYKKRYPGSPYVRQFQPAINAMIQKESQGMTDKMVFAEANGSKLNTLDEVLALSKGKTVLVDMWGTWCGPCREEIEKNTAEVKKYFKDKGLDYLYVANYDTRNEKAWKKLIAYFHLEGTHILASDKLNKDIMAKVKGQGYPTYFIIKKDGTYELSKAGYPMKRDVLIQQLETAMAQ